MKKIRVLLLTICLLSLCALLLTSCGGRLSTPSGLHFDEDTLTLKWNRVRGAHGYTVEISGMETDITTQANYVSLEKLEPGDYEIRVCANGDGKSSKNSHFAKIPFKREPESKSTATMYIPASVPTVKMHQPHFWKPCGKSNAFIMSKFNVKQIYLYSNTPQM